MAVDTLAAVAQQGRAADRLLQAAFREQRQMGGRDRALVGDLVYGVLRDLRRLQHLAGADASAAQWCALYALETGLADATRLADFGFAQAQALALRLQHFDASALSPAERLNVPDDIYALWLAELGAARAEQLAQSLKQQAPVDLRVNTLKTSRESARYALLDAGIESSPTRHSPAGLRLHKRAALQALGLFRDGWIEPQDEGSQLLALLVAAQPGERIADWCAGAGGKTLALAAQMQDRGELVAMDTDAARLERMAPRLRRAGIHCVRFRAAPPVAAHDERDLFDAVLVDAPCSGSGTWRRQPEARLKRLDLPALAQLQIEILAQAAARVRPGGRLVYATCSLLRPENEGVVERFLAAHTEFVAEDAGAVLIAQGVDLAGRYLQLYPDRHGTDGFFGACMRRRVAA